MDVLNPLKQHIARVLDLIGVRQLLPGDLSQQVLYPKKNAHITDQAEIRVTDDRPRILSTGGVSAFGRYIYAEPGSDGVLRKENGGPYLAIAYGIIGYADPTQGSDGEVACITEKDEFLCEKQTL